jgi:AbrB family looped-hinge helix DNA binding protein
MTVILKDKKPIVVPDAVRRKAGLRGGDEVEFRVSGRAITIVPKESGADDYPLEAVARIIKEARERPVTRRQGAALDAALMAYGAKQAKKVGIKEGDIPRLIHASRSRRRPS